MPRNKTKWLDRAAVIAPFHYTLCTTEKRYAAALDHLKIPKELRPPFLNSWHAGATLHWFENKRLRSVTGVLCFRKDKKKDHEANYALLVHEAVHLWQEMRRLFGENDPSSEFEAYSIQNLVQSLMYEFERQTRRK